LFLLSLALVVASFFFFVLLSTGGGKIFLHHQSFAAAHLKISFLSLFHDLQPLIPFSHYFMPKTN
jgi:hypothetical protein